MSQPHLLPIPKARSEAARLYGLDWLRAVATLLVLFLHAGIPYMSQPMPGLLWSVHYDEGSEAVNAFCWGVDSFIMPLFFIMSGFLAAQLLESKGAQTYLKHRLLRIGGPILFGFAVILPFDLYAWLLGMVARGDVPFAKLKSLKLGGTPGEGLWGMAHLWYLQYLLIYCIAAGVLSKTKLASKIRLPVEHVFAVGIVVGASLLYFHPRILLGFRQEFIPPASNLSFFAWSFALGWVWKATDFHPKRTHYCVLVVGTVASAWITQSPLHAHLDLEQVPMADPRLALGFTTCGLAMSALLFALSTELPFRQPPAAITYLAKASFWIYLFHHPLVGLIHVDMRLIKASPVAKFWVTGVLATAICLATFEVFVRRTWVGALLNGRRDLPRTDAVDQSNVKAAPAKPLAA